MSSPAWKNPRDSLKRHSTRRRSARGKLDMDTGSLPAAGGGKMAGRSPLVDNNDMAGSLRYNPFQRAAAARHKPSTQGAAAEDSGVLRVMEMVDASSERGSPSSPSTSTTGEPIDFSSLLAPSSTKPSPSPASQQAAPSVVSPFANSSPVAPIDLRPAVSLRVTTTVRPPIQQFDHAQDGRLRLRGLDNVCALDGGKVHLTNGLNGAAEEDSNWTMQTSPASFAPSLSVNLLAASQTWQFPYKPGHNIFPRRTNHQRLIQSTERSSVVTVASEGKSVADLLHTDWLRSFESAYQSVKYGRMPFVYVCCQALTVVFTNWGEGRLTAVMAPTSEPLRQVMTNYGIKFTSETERNNRTSAVGDNARKLSHSQSCIDSPLGKQHQNKPSLEDESLDESLAWLDSMGVSPNVSHKMRMQRAASNADHSLLLQQQSTSSACIVQGRCNVHALYNYLLSCRLCHPTVGAQAGLPPTLLAPQHFLMSTLLQSHTTLRTIVRPLTATQYVIEVGMDGIALLPTNIAAIHDALRNADITEYTLDVQGRQCYEGLNAAHRSNNKESSAQNSVSSLALRRQSSSSASTSIDGTPFGRQLGDAVIDDLPTTLRYSKKLDIAYQW